MRSADSLKVFLSPGEPTLRGTGQMARSQEGPAEVTKPMGHSRRLSGLRLPFEQTQKARARVDARRQAHQREDQRGVRRGIFEAEAHSNPVAAHEHQTHQVGPRARLALQ